MKQGMFIVFEGNDGSGKATQAKLLAERLEKEGLPVARADFPSYERTFFGTLVGECLTGKHGDFVNMDPKIASTLYALDRFEATPGLTDLLAEGKIVIADRFSSSNQIHQGGKIADSAERAAFLGWLSKMEHEVLGIPRPDAVIYLRVPVSMSLQLLSEKRAAKNQSLQAGERDTVESDRAYLERSFAAAELLSKNEPGWHAIDCMDGEALRSREAIHEDVYKLVRSLLV